MPFLVSLVLWSVMLPPGPHTPAGPHRSVPHARRAMTSVVPLRSSLPVRSPADAPGVGLFGEEEDSSDGDGFGCLVSETRPDPVACRALKPSDGRHSGPAGAVHGPLRLRC